MTASSETARTVAALHATRVVVDGHCHLAKGIVAHREDGENDVFKTRFLPLLRNGGVNVLCAIIGGDNISMVNGSDLFLWGTLNVLDHCLAEFEANQDVLALCSTTAEIDAALAADKIVVVLALEGCRPLEGRPMQDELSSLHIFHRLGVRSLQLTCNGRNKLADGVAEAGSGGGLTRFGRSVVQEAMRLGMLLDISHLAPAGVENVLALTDGPIVASHANARKVCDHARNLDDDVIGEIARRGGVVGLTLFSTLINKDRDLATVDDLVDHIDHIAGVAGIDHVGLGPDFSEFSSVLNPWTGSRGNMEGIGYGKKDHYFHPELRDWRHFPNISRRMIERGYAPDDVAKLMGENFLRLYRTVLA